MKIAREDGVALLLVLVMLLVVSLLAAWLMFTAQSETWSSMNYRLMTQAKYGAEAGIHRAANHLLNTYAAPAAAGADPIGAYTMTASPVTFNNNPVVLSSNADVGANYPVAAVSTAFRDAVQGTFTAGNSVVTYTASATLTSMEQITVYGSTTPVAVQTWTINGYGTINGARSAQIEVSTVMERLTVPAFSYAAFATAPACGAMSLVGNAGTNSYDSGNITWSGGQPVTQNYGGNVGTNGNLSESGNATINGTLSTPRSGVGSCSAGNMTALTRAGNATVTGGIVNLPQVVTYQTPALPNPLPPTTNTNYGGHASATLAPGSYGNISMTAQSVLHLSAGTYNINSLSMAGQSQIVIDSGPVVLNVVGTGETMPIDMNGGGLVNATMDPSLFQIQYAGTGTVRMTGGSQQAALVYAPNANGVLVGNSDFYGAMIVSTLSYTGNGTIHYDRRLQNSLLTLGNAMMSGFSWKKF